MYPFTWYQVWETRVSGRKIRDNSTYYQQKCQNHSEPRERRMGAQSLGCLPGPTLVAFLVALYSLTGSVSHKVGTNSEGGALPHFTDGDTGTQSSQVTCTK